MKSTTIILPKESDLQLTRNFNASELRCRCANKSCDLTLIDLEHLAKLQKLRDEVGLLKITSAYRCEAHNKAVGGSKNSQHRLGCATDIVSPTLFPGEVSEKCEHFQGLGVYSNFVHIDSRVGKKARWGIV